MSPSSRSHRNICAYKHQQRTDQFASVKASHSSPFTPDEERAFSLSLSDIVSSCSTGETSPAVVRDAYMKRTVAAHVATNCISDFLPENHATPTEKDQRPFLGVPISVKDCYDYEGHDTTLGYSRNANRPATSSSVLVKMLLSAGATLHVKTTVPTGLLALETESDLFGYTSNPYNHKYSAGASTGGGAALLAFRGSKIEIGNDIGGSVRMPAGWCGIYGLKASYGRFPQTGVIDSAPGLEGIKTIASPMASNLDDLEEFCHRFIDLKPWIHDSQCIPLPWQPCDFLSDKKLLKFGVIWNDGIIPPSPASTRALELAVNALKHQGHEVMDFTPPSVLEGLRIGYQTAFSAGIGPSFDPKQSGEVMNEGIRGTKFLLSLPLFIKRIMAFFLRTFSRPLGRNEAFAAILDVFHESSSAAQVRKLAVQQQEYQQKWNEKWKNEGLDFVLTVPYPTPAIPRGSTGKATLISAGYCFLYNLLDFTAGVLPVTFVDKTLDTLPPNFEKTPEYGRLNDIARGVYSVYDAEGMHGLPLGVQIVGRRFEEERVLGGMKVVRAALAAAGNAFSAKVF